MARYLLLDDNPAFAENLAEILRDLDHEVTVAATCDEAVAAAGASRYDVLLTDMRMPGKSGAVAVREVREVDPGLAAIVITAYPGESDLASARREGVLAVLPKPVPIDALVALLSSARRNAVVALVEDDEALSDNLSDMLRTRGFSVVKASALKDVERMAYAKPFVALVDYRVPGGPDGAAVERLKAHAPDMPLVVMTAFPEKAETGKLPVLAKPFSPEALIEHIERLYGERRGSR